MNYSDDCLPKSGKNGFQQLSHRPVPQHQPQNQAQKQGNADVSPAEAKHQLQPCPAESQQKQSVAEGRPLSPQGPEEAIPDPQPSAPEQRRQEPLGANHRLRHPNSRRQPEAGRFSS